MPAASPASVPCAVPAVRSNRDAGRGVRNSWRCPCRLRRRDGRRPLRRSGCRCRPDLNSEGRRPPPPTRTSDAGPFRWIVRGARRDLGRQRRAPFVVGRKLGRTRFPRSGRRSRACRRCCRRPPAEALRDASQDRCCSRFPEAEDARVSTPRPRTRDRGFRSSRTSTKDSPAEASAPIVPKSPEIDVKPPDTCCSELTSRHRPGAGRRWRPTAESTVGPGTWIEAASTARRARGAFRQACPATGSSVFRSTVRRTVRAMALTVLSAGGPDPSAARARNRHNQGGERGNDRWSRSAPSGCRLNAKTPVRGTGRGKIVGQPSWTPCRITGPPDVSRPE